MSASDFSLNAPIERRGGYSLREMKSNLAAYKDLIRQGIETSTRDTQIEARNDENTLRGLRQGTNQCFATCVAGYLALQGLTIERARRFVGEAHRQLSDDYMVGVVASGRIGGEVFDDILKRLLQTAGLTMKVGVENGHIAPSWASNTVFEKGKTIGREMFRGAGLIFQDGNHFKLAFVDKTGFWFIFDPLKGEARKTNVQEILDQWQPLNIQENLPTYVLLTAKNKGEDFVVHDNEADFVMH